MADNEFPAGQRRILKDRDDWRCARCAVPVSDNAHVHNRKLRSRGGGRDLSNGVLLCPTCHHWVHHNVEKATEQGFIVASRAFTALTPVTTWRGRIWLDDIGSWRPTR